MKIEPKRALLVLIALALLVAGVWAAIAALRPLPERTFTMATGPAGSAQAAVGEQSRALLAKEGVTLRLVETGGSFDNVALLRDPKSRVSAAFVQGGTTSPSESPGLLSLGTLFYEPLWIFCRCTPDGAADVRAFGAHVSIGPKGSTTHATTLKLLTMSGIDPSRFRLEGYAPDKAADELLAGRLDTVVIDTGWESPAVQRLLADPSINVFNSPRADAYVALVPYLSKVKLPMGVANLAANRPPQDVFLLANKASLVVREDLHPALQYLLIDAATKIHGGPGIFNPAGTFPAAEMGDLPLSDEAQALYRSGPSFLRRHLPFWLAELVQRLLLLLVPLAGVVYPVFRFAPDAWRWQQERRVLGMYRELRRVEQQLRDSPDVARRAELHARLDDLEARAAQVKLSDTFAAPSYELKQNIRFVQDRYR
jgi:TRAP-type uncharacterized transport system substrate-binding protein